MPVRDALQKLLAEGLVILEPNRGTFVGSLTDEQCAEIFDPRAILEPDAQRRAVPKHTGSRAEQTHQWARGDREFHELLCALCDRPRTLEIIQTLRDAVQRLCLPKCATPISGGVGRESADASLLRSQGTTSKRHVQRSARACAKLNAS
jgi:DNA-binding GntR family transcriptional regulator